jgi:hypothetical protein
MATAQLHFDDGEWPSGKALGSTPHKMEFCGDPECSRIGVRVAGGNSQGRSRDGGEAGSRNFSAEKYS